MPAESIASNVPIGHAAVCSVSTDLHPRSWLSDLGWCAFTSSGHAQWQHNPVDDLQCYFCTALLDLFQVVARGAAILVSGLEVPARSGALAVAGFVMISSKGL